MEVKVDLAILAIGMTPRKDSENISRILHIPKGPDGFLLEAHPKLRPVDTHTSGIFLAGACLGPKDIPESVAQAKAAASSAASLLSKGRIKIESMIAQVNEDLCSGCRICEYPCSYGAIEMLEKEGKTVAHVIEALCKGCGVCGAACPTKAITIRHFTTDQILAQVKAILREIEVATA